MRKNGTEKALEQAGVKVLKNEMDSIIAGKMPEV